MTTTFRPGRIANDPSKPRLALGKYLAGSVPAAVDYYSKVTTWGIDGNDLWGDCTCAADSHCVVQQSLYGTGVRNEPTTDQTLAAYSAISGFNAGAGPPGSNPTDNGATVQDALNYLRKTGISGFKIAAFGELNVKDHAQIKLGVYQFGCLSIGINLPASAMDQFDASQPWTPVAGSAISGGHCVIVAGYDADFVYIVTWGKVQKMSWAFWDAYVEEAWAVIDGQWANAVSLDTAVLGAEWAALTGQPNPFKPAPVPVPVPPPAPAPVPVPVPPAPPKPPSPPVPGELSWLRNELVAILDWIDGKEAV